MPKKQKIKVIREVAPVVKEIKHTDESEGQQGESSALESEVESSGSLPAPRASFTETILHSDEPAQVQRPAVQAAARQGEENFSQSLSYAPKPAGQEERRYTSSAEAEAIPRPSQINPTIRAADIRLQPSLRPETIRDTNSLSLNTDLLDTEQSGRRYYEESQANSLKPKRKYPWEA